ncbi:tannase/feruloyl esterase family alpha/beta hydrolase [Phyllobacterium sp. YR531]|uniref:tannase/feruloyl esterase family alpha/beta hydrolase n=1 Tax=Phyllobacterium sp. YR531 TaxID=1144343 RepID=UPI00026FB1F5|nr:tannase/feruloyl esterase family alpha/beta hydrolase [Phyllobacterium sp. YR531]EJN05830.1 Tannase and feruloyl esterase [Phyllobacterium sp. YR531]
MRYPSLLVSTLLALLASIAPGVAQNKSSFIDQSDNAGFVAPTVDAQMSCQSLNSSNFSDISLLKAIHFDATDKIPAHCQVTGYIRPEIKFEITLPARWNRRIYMFGNGGYAGENLADPTRIETRDQALARGFVTVQQNTGHDAATYNLGDFANGNLDRLIDYASRAVHVVVISTKSIATHYYDRHPTFSYWDGCSTGGRQGLMSAQRYPADFDGILAGAPALDFTGTQLWGVWNARVLEKAPISKAQLRVLAKTVMDKCDRPDGAEDGLITDPRACKFDPQKDLPICEKVVSSDCFTENQAQALTKISEGVKINGEVVFPGVPWGVEGLDDGGESGWNRWIISDNGPSRQLTYGETFLRNMAMLPESGKDIDWRSFDFDAEYTKIQAIRNILDATDSDLSEFQKRGGKMISYFGWADPALNPMMGVNYYESVREKLSAERTDEFYRLFMVPGMFHCRQGYGTDTFDAFTPLIDWVENGKAPDVIQARQVKGGHIIRTRPLCAYPLAAKYSGSGDLNDGANFSCTTSDGK